MPSQVTIIPNSLLMCKWEAGMVFKVCDELLSPEFPEEDQEDAGRFKVMKTRFQKRNMRM